MPKKRSPTKGITRTTDYPSTDEQRNALEQERLRSTISELLIRSVADLRRELTSVTERNRIRFDRIRDQLSAIREGERTALLITFHTDVEQILAAYWFFLTSQKFPESTNSPSVPESVSVTEVLEPFREFLFE
jgi:hypothetical protein